MFDSVYALTLCNTLVFNVAEYAFGNYLSFSLGLLLAFFARPASDDKGMISRITRFANKTAVIQLMLLIAFMTYMTIRFFPLNNTKVPIILYFASLVMYGLCGAIILTQFICNRNWRHGISMIFFVPLYINQMLIQAYTVLNFPSNGYMLIFQWVSLLSILLAIPLYIILVVFIGFKNNERKFLYVVLYPFVFQIYLHVGYLCFYLYCNEGYLSSILLFLSSFALFNVLHSAYNLIFTKPEFAEDKSNDVEKR
ncbi:high osmolarity signaling protein sho1 [Gigaspora margarita]|uniref:High osmolarity signaling protein sho1 n=1 Tax=Gigaspora margarita TaxID=4874 RepID=A0A8H3XC15_GIGMA|nr:high osmolarity signaling protein sho1 [Gigaspora margarita]